MLIVTFYVGHGGGFHVFMCEMETLNEELPTFLSSDLILQKVLTLYNN